METSIKHLVATLIGRLHIDQIYQWEYARNGKKLTLLHIHLQPESGMRFGEAKEICINLFEKHPMVFFTLYYRREVQHFIEDGLARFRLICRAENKIYPLPELNEEVDTVLEPLSLLLNKSKGYIATERNKISAFIEGYEFYRNAGNTAHAALMLHQALELTLRLASMLLVGYEKKSHCLLNNVEHLRTYDSVLGKLCIKDRDHQAIKLLDQAYNHTRYYQDYQISDDQLDLAEQVSQRSIDWIETYQQEYIREIEQEFSPAYQAKKRTLKLKEAFIQEHNSTKNTDPKELILQALKIYTNHISVRFFAYRSQQQQWNNRCTVMNEEQITQRYYLCIGLYDDEQLGTLDLQAKINDLLPDYARVTLILEDEKSMLRKAKKGNLFFFAVLQHAELWKAGEGVDHSREELASPHRSTTYVKKQWEARLQNTRTFTHLHPSGIIGDERAVGFGLALALEQIFLGLIKAFLGYSCPIVNLNYLLQLVDSINPDLGTRFFLDNNNHRPLFKLLVNGQQKFRHTTSSTVNQEDLERLSRLVNEYIVAAAHYVELYFEEQSFSETDSSELVEEDQIVETREISVLTEQPQVRCDEIRNASYIPTNGSMYG